MLGGCLGVTDESDESDTAGPGAKAPWAEADSPVDIVISNTRSEAVTATLTMAGDERTISIGVNDDWVSEDILMQGENATVTVATPDNLTATVKWIPEDESTNRICVFNIDPDRIRTDMFVK